MNTRVEFEWVGGVLELDIPSPPAPLPRIGRGAGGEGKYLSLLVEPVWIVIIGGVPNYPAVSAGDFGDRLHLGT